MARAATTSDVSQCRRRATARPILNLLKGGERSVNELARSLRVRQPQASKHLRVLKEVGLVHVREAGQAALHLAGRGTQADSRCTSFTQLRSESFDRL
jgi:DNA-binding transcriptional ArsR family regulator